MPGEAKDPDNSHLVTLFDAFAPAEERELFRADLRGGLGWGEAKQRFLAVLERELGPMREKYDELMSRPEHIEELLQAGAAKARAVATPFLAELREAVGLRRFNAIPVAVEKKMEAAAPQLPVFKQYREADGKFYFKLSSHDGRLLLQSEGFDSGRDAGQWVGRLKSEGASALDGVPASFGEGVSREDVAAALGAFAQ